MALTLYNIRKWYKMLTGKSVMHVNQNLGKCFERAELKGYYNNLTEKVTMLPQLLNTDELPQYLTTKGAWIVFPVDIFQYGLGAYDLFLITREDIYLKKFRQCVEWTLLHQEPSGAWDNFSFRYPNNPYGAMAQGEAASLLLRAYCQFGRSDCLDAAHRAIDYMITPLEDGGTTLFKDDQVILMEYTHLPAVMNGWIFAWWGLYDFVLASKDEGIYQRLLERSVRSLVEKLPSFTNGFWSMYDLDGHIASPFYHHLHIAQMQAMYQLTGNDVFNSYALQWKRYENNAWFRGCAFCVKAWQKLKERE